MRIVSWNVNGIRSVYAKGFLDWLQKHEPDTVCLQEVKAEGEQLPDAMLNPLGYTRLWHTGTRRGYSGVAMYTRSVPTDVRNGLGVREFDAEGRTMEVDFKDFTLINAYFPNSQRDHARLPFKVQFCDAITNRMRQLRAKGRNALICGDFNIAHKEIDLKNPKENRNNAGFLPEERAWLDAFEQDGFVDTFRIFQPEGGHYTWWSYRPTIRERNIGWRLDYFWCNREMKDRVSGVIHQPEVMGSDHCPVVITLRD